MSKLYISWVAIFGAITVYGQSNPSPFPLTSGTYTFNSWASTAPAGTYPPHMVFQRYSGESANVGEDSPLVADWRCAYNIATRSRIEGAGPNGITFINTGNYQDTEERCLGGPGVVGGYVGAALLAINTTGLQNISGNWTATMVSPPQPDPGNDPRIYQVRLSYRIGTSGAFVPVQGNLFSTDQAGLDAPENFTFTLPAECNNQAVVQLRWQYYQSFQGQGARPFIRLGNISVSGLPTEVSQAAIRAGLQAWPNPNTEGILNLNRNVNATLFDITGKPVFQVANANRIALDALAPGVYILRTDRGEAIKVLRR